MEAGKERESKEERVRETRERMFFCFFIFLLSEKEERECNLSWWSRPPNSQVQVKDY